MENNIYQEFCSDQFKEIHREISKIRDTIPPIERRFNERVEGKIDKLESKVTDRFLNLENQIDGLRDDLMNRIEPLNNFKYKMIGSIVVIVFVLSTIVSYTVASLNFKRATELSQPAIIDRKKGT